MLIFDSRFVQDSIDVIIALRKILLFLELVHANDMKKKLWVELWGSGSVVSLVYFFFG